MMRAMARFTPRQVRRKQLIRAALISAVFVIGFAAALALGAYGTHWYTARSTYAAPALTLIDPRTDARTDIPYGEHELFRQPDFFAQTHAALIEHKTTFLEANLSDMKLRFYRDGVLELEVDIATKGREGSWWETPAGLYAIQSKSENHFSSFGHVYQPWSMAFQGNFFIHGRPYYPDGTLVSSDFSGGCIRLSTEDAETIYKLVEVGTPVLVYEDDYGSDGFTYELPAPDVSAKHYAVLDIESGTMLAATGIHEVQPIASITKLVTALVAAEYINLDKDLPVYEHLLASTSIPRLQAGSQVSAYALLLPLLLESSNEAAEVFAAAVGRDRFIALMNEKVKALGMHDTHFTDPAGSEHANVSSVADLLRLAQYLNNNRGFVLRISSGEDVPTLYRTEAFEGLQNFNTAAGADGFIGGKTGKNSVGETALLFYTVSVDGVSRRLAVAVLDSDNFAADVHALLAHVEKTYGATVAPGF